MKLVSWNMNLSRAAGNWGAFRQDGMHRCDIALLNEATPPPPDLADHVFGEGKTVGRDDKSLGGNKTRNWAAVVFSPHPMNAPADVWSLPPQTGDRRSQLSASRPGSWAAAEVDVEGFGPVTAISLYGLLDERSDASVHRSISDITPILEDKRYNGNLVLGGDLNTLAAAPAGSRRLARDQGVLNRITTGFGLTDLLRVSLRSRNPQRGGLAGCKCGRGTDCDHTWTYRSARTPTIPHQDDYLFASAALTERMESCVAIEFDDASTSDHAPIVAAFN